MKLWGQGTIESINEREGYVRFCDLQISFEEQSSQDFANISNQDM